MYKKINQKINFHFFYRFYIRWAWGGYDIVHNICTRLTKSLPTEQIQFWGFPFCDKTVDFRVNGVIRESFQQLLITSGMGSWFLLHESFPKLPSPTFLLHHSCFQDATAGVLRPGFHGQDFTANFPQPGFHSQDSTDRVPNAGYQGFHSHGSTTWIPQAEFQDKASTTRSVQKMLFGFLRSGE